MIDRFALTKRPYLGTTSMDTELAFLMANQAQAGHAHRARARTRRGVSVNAGSPVTWAPFPRACPGAPGGVGRRPVRRHRFVPDRRWPPMPPWSHTTRLECARVPVERLWPSPGSILVPMAHFGAFTLGLEIDPRILRGTGRHISNNKRTPGAGWRRGAPASTAEPGIHGRRWVASWRGARAGRGVRQPGPRSRVTLSSSASGTGRTS